VEFAGVPSARGVVAVPRACLKVHETLNFIFIFFLILVSIFFLRL
jgi:hypothetical protein